MRTYTEPCADNPNLVDTCTIFDSFHEFTTKANNSSFRDHFRRDFHGGKDYRTREQVKSALSKGNLGLVGRSDKLMKHFEELIIAPRPNYEVIPNVAGGFAMVPEMLAGSPVHMRMRRRTRSQLAPLSIVVDLASSGGIEASLVEKRGTMALALVRALSEIRPVNLYGLNIADVYSSDKANSGVLFPIETSPMDLAHAAHCLIHQSVPRGIMYELCSTLVGRHYFGMSWAWRDINKHRKLAPELCARALGEEVYYLPPMYLYDEGMNDPEAWFRARLTELSENA